MAMSNIVQTMALNDQKAGMQGLDKDRVNRIIYESSKGSNFFQHQLRRQQRIDKRAKEMETSLQDFSEDQRQKAKHDMDLMAKKLESSRDLTKIIVHIDMDAFYAAVEIRDDPTLADKPVAVGSTSMLSTSNYRARAFGVRAAMPGFIAKKLCPELVIVPPNFDKYRSISKMVSSVLNEYASDVLMASLDEAYLDITQCVLDRTSINDCGSVSDEVVREIRDKIFQVTGLTSSAGIAPNMTLAKICSDRNKPNGQFQLASNLNLVQKFVSELPVRKVSGIGPVQDQLFANLGIVTCGHLWDNREILPLIFTPTAVDFYMSVAMGMGSVCVKGNDSRKSIGTEESFREISNPEQLFEKCKELCHDLVEDLVKRSLVGKVVVLKLKNVKFEVTTRNCTLGYYTCSVETIFAACKRMLEREIAAARPSLLRLRLMGVRLQCLLPGNTGTKQSILSFERAESLPLTKDCVHCPVCDRTLSADNLQVVNDHIDKCLNRQAIKGILYSDRDESEHSSKRKTATTSGRNYKSKRSKLMASKSIDSYFRVNT